MFYENKGTEINQSQHTQAKLILFFKLGFITSYTTKIKTGHNCKYI
jgi:hypothetical protein